MREAAERRVQELTAPKDTPRQTAEGKPSPDQFKTYDEYTEALADWKVEEKLRNLGQKEEERRREQTAEAQRADVVQKLAPALAKYPDFEEVALGDHVTITPIMGQAALAMGADGHDVLYYLGQNPKESERIARLGVVEQIRELDKLAVAIKPKPKATQAPPPIQPNEGSATVEKKLEEASYDEFVKIRRRQIAQRG